MRYKILQKVGFNGFKKLIVGACFLSLFFLPMTSNVFALDKEVDIDTVTYTNSSNFILSQSVANAGIVQDFKATLDVAINPSEENVTKAKEIVLSEKEEEKVEETLVSSADAQPVPATTVAVEESKVQTGKFYLPECPLSPDVQQFIYDRAILKNIPVDTMFAMGMLESGFDTNIVSKTNDYGLFQINIGNHAHYAKLTGTKNAPFDPYVNTIWSTTIMGDYLGQWRDKLGDTKEALQHALSCYNAGPTQKIKQSYVKRYDTAHATVEQWFVNNGYEDLIKG